MSTEYNPINSLHLSGNLDEMESNTSPPAHKTIGSYLLEAGLITAETLNEALLLAQRIGIRIGRALILLQHVSETEFMTFLSQQQAVPFLEHSNQPIDPAVARLLPAQTARRLGVLPVVAHEQEVVVATIDPLNKFALQQVEMILDRKVTPMAITEQTFEYVLEILYQEEYTYQSTKGLLTSQPQESAFQVLSRGQKVVFGLLLVLSIFWLLAYPISFFSTFNTLATLFYIVFSAHRFYLISHALSSELEVAVSDAEITALTDRELPIYTILVPVYREANVLPKLMHAITSLDYPLAKLDVKLLMEADDIETIQAARALNLPPNIEHVIIPDSLPKTKPKACNYGLIKARGEYVVIFDAEDLPEPDQLKKVVLAFRKAGEEVACIQAKLNYYNRNQNLLTRWFTIEYSMWFDLFLPGLDASDAPVPLGGTSNHFRREQLEALGAWDPFNVTEDADLGVRLYKAGYKTAIIDSTTFEEANSHLRNWVRQRSRWVKGYIQTWLVHMRHPIALWRAIGTKAFLSFNLTIGGNFIGYLLNPLYWGFTILWFITRWGFIQQVFPATIFYLGIVSLFVGNCTFVYINVAGSMRRGFYDLVKYALISPLYWVLISIGAWKGFIQLFTKPFYWEKTIHGLDIDTHTTEEPNNFKMSIPASQQEQLS